MEIKKLIQALDAFAALHSDPNAVHQHHFRVLLEVFKHDDQCLYKDVMEAVGLANSSVSRIVHALGAEHRTGRPGLGLLKVFRDPDYGRRYVIALTPKGTAFKRQLKNL